MQWYHGAGGQQQGPVSTEDLKELIAQGRLRATDLVWREGLSGWLPLAQVPELASVEGAPPPLPAPSGPPAAALAVGAAPLPRPTRRERPWVLSVLAVLWMVSGLPLLGLGAWMLVSGRGGADSTPSLIFGLVLLGFGLLASLAGWGTWTLRRLGWVLAILLSVLSLVFIPLGTICGILLLVYLGSPGVRLLFSEKPLDLLDDREAQQLAALPQSGLGIAVAVVLLGSLTLSLLILPGIAIPNLLNAIQRGKQKRTMGDLRVVATAVESYAIDNGAYPVPSGPTVASIAPLLEPTYVAALPLVDGWSGEFLYELSPDGVGYRLESYAKDGVDSGPDVGTTHLFSDDIVFESGSFVCYPDGVQR